MLVIKNKVVQNQNTGLFSGMLPIELDEGKEDDQVIRFYGGKITQEQWNQVKSFLRWSQHEFKGEAQIRMFYSKERGVWKMHPFEQYISTTLSTSEAKDSVKNNEIVAALLQEGCVCMGTTHHHCTAGAFQSPTDYNDEVTQNGLHITLGNMESPVFGFHSRVSFRGLMYKAELSDWFEENIDLTTDVGIEAFPPEWKSLLIQRPSPVVHHYPSTHHGNYYGNYHGKNKSKPYYWEDDYEDWYLDRYYPVTKKESTEKTLDEHIGMIINSFQLAPHIGINHTALNKIKEIINVMDDFTSCYKDTVVGETEFRDFLNATLTIVDMCLLDDPYKLKTKKLVSVLENTIWLRFYTDLSIAEYFDCEEEYYNLVAREDEMETSKDKEHESEKSLEEKWEDQEPDTFIPTKPDKGDQ